MRQTRELGPRALGALFGAVVFLQASLGSAEPGTPKPEVECPSSRCVREKRSWDHWLAARYDLGSASSYGARYLVGPGVTTEFGHGDYRHSGLGVDFRWLRGDKERATALSLVGRRTVLVPFGISLEVTGGVVMPRAGSVRGIASVGAFFALSALDVGYSYGFPLGGARADYMASHQFSVRLNIPIFEHSAEIRDTVLGRPPEPDPVPVPVQFASAR